MNKKNIKTATVIIFEIDDKILKEASKCSYEFGCLENENHVCLAKVNDCIDAKIHFVNCIAKRCNYYLSFGSHVVCNCPVRKEIFNKYGK